MRTGSFAAALGLSGEVTAEQFRAALDGADPTTGQTLKRAGHVDEQRWSVLSMVVRP